MPWRAAAVGAGAAAQLAGELPPVAVPPVAAAAPAMSSTGEVRLRREDVCVSPDEVAAVFADSALRVARGLPPWTAKPAVPPKDTADLRIAYFVQLSAPQKLPMARRAFDRLYSPKDVFLYFTDSRLLAPERVEEALGLTGLAPRSNVRVVAAPHADYFYWPRVQVVLDGLTALLSMQWDFVVHLSESDYPVHSSAWIRAALAQQRNSNFIHALPRCEAGEREMKPFELLALRSRLNIDILEDAETLPPAATMAPNAVSQDSWYWWGQRRLVASCGNEFVPTEVEGHVFPTEALEQSGLVFARGPEWVILTRELVEYASKSDLQHFKRMIGMHPGADEMFWATLVFNIPNFTQRISRQGWYMRWEKNSTDHSPDEITERHMPRIMEGRNSFLFVRKVDAVKSAGVLNALDAASAVEDDRLSTLQASAQDWALPPIDHRRLLCNSAGA